MKKLHATVDDPLHLFFFVKDEGQASRYAKRGGERFDGNATEVRIGEASVTTLRNLVAMPAAAQEKADSTILNQIATSLSVASSIEVDGRMRKRNPTQLLEAMHSVFPGKMSTRKSGHVSRRPSRACPMIRALKSSTKEQWCST